MFFDELSLVVEGGKGGNGFVSFHREKFVAFGPPDGGDGGDGGNVVIKANSNLNTFRNFGGKKHFKANGGKDGHKNNRVGHGGSDIILEVPLGTIITDQSTGEQLADLKKNEQEIVIAKGGRGGYGNGHFATSTRQAPKFAELGDIGEKKEIRLEIQLVADVGLLGFPSAGKSTLISHVSAAKPKIGDYPFTTLVPNLGVVQLSKFGGAQNQTFVIADMPGIIEGASEGKGLGDRFLKHISRTALLVYVLDPFSYDGKEIADQYSILNKEIETYKKALIEKDFFVVMNKIDAIPHEDREELTESLLSAHPELKDKLHLISGVSGENLKEFLFELWNKIQEEKAEQVDLPEEEEAMPNYTPIHFVDNKSFELTLEGTFDAEALIDGVHGALISPESRAERKVFNVSGERIEQISRMSNLEQEGALQRLYDVLDKMGIMDELRRQGAEVGDYVKIAWHTLEYHPLK